LSRHDAALLALVVALFVIAPFLTIAVYLPSVFSSNDQTGQSLETSTSNSTDLCTPNSLCPSMVDTAYGFDSLFEAGVTGQGQTIVIVDACGDPTLSADLKTFDSTFDLPSPPSLKIISIGGSPCVDSGWNGETALDVEWAHVAAPKATIYVLVAAIPDPRDMYGAWTYALNNHLGNQISNSFGGAGCYNGLCNARIGQGIGSCNSTRGTQGVNVADILVRAEKQDVTVIAGAGDTGAMGMDAFEQEAVPADCAGVLTVGGTTLAVNSSGYYEGESAWNGSTGGGYISNSEPWYQSYVNITDPLGVLGKPDVAAVADPNTGVEVYDNSTWQVIGGTSLSTPLWAGFVADVNQLRSENKLHPLGFVNPFLYMTVYGVNGSSPLYSQDFHDITGGSNNPWAAWSGWNPDAGLGTFIVPALAETLGTNPAA
jgi:subtilase family serine protease